MRLIVTRPAGDAERWCADLRAHGIDAVALPLIAIGPARCTEAVVQMRKQLANYDAAMFVSSNAVAYFLKENWPLAQQIPGLAAIKTRAWAPGPGTARALVDAGWPAALVDGPAAEAAQFDSESLWNQVGMQIGPGSRVLIVRGEEAGVAAADMTAGAASTVAQPASTEGRGRDWLESQLRAAGATVDKVAVYARHPPLLSPMQQALAAQSAEAADACWLFSSSDAVRNLRAALPALQWHRARAIATHPRIAEAARAAGFGRIDTVAPTLGSLVAHWGVDRIAR